MVDQRGPDAPATAAPDGLPVLSAGAHRRPHHGSCLMEYVSVLAGEPWSDRPRCTDRALAQLARRVNDGISSEARPALAQLAPRLVGAVGPERCTDVVAAAIARVGLEDSPEDRTLMRVHRRVHRRLAREAGDPGGRPRRGLRCWDRIARAAGVADAYADFEQMLAGRPRAARDAARLRALSVAVEDVRRVSTPPAVDHAGPSALVQAVAVLDDAPRRVRHPR